jgi:hypothetical protein
MEQSLLDESHLDPANGNSTGLIGQLIADASTEQLDLD